MVQALQSYFYTLQNVICFVGGKKKTPLRTWLVCFIELKIETYMILKMVLIN